jgi:hypothetical protein
LEIFFITFAFSLFAKVLEKHQSWSEIIGYISFQMIAQRQGSFLLCVGKIQVGLGISWVSSLPHSTNLSIDHNSVPSSYSLLGEKE